MKKKKDARRETLPSTKKGLGIVLGSGKKRKNTIGKSGFSKSQEGVFVGPHK